MSSDRRKRLNFRKLFSFSCTKPSLQDNHAHIGSPGYTRVVYANDPHCLEATNLNYVNNYVSTTKYTLASFIPKSLFEQFRRIANIYFLVIGCLAFTPLAPYVAVSAILPLTIVIGATMAKEGIEDLRRKQQDDEVNNRMVKVHVGNGIFNYTKWKNILVGDIVKVEKDKFFPADLILLSSNYEEGICYVETMNLDGETNLKLKQSLEATSNLQDDSNFQNFNAVINCEDPNAKLYSFVGTVEYLGQKYPLSPQQLLLRDSKLRNTDFIYGVAIFTGHDTKIMQNATNPPSKRSKIERKIDKLIYLLLSFLVLIATVGSIFFGIQTSNDLVNGKMKRWYLRPDATKVLYDPKRAPLASFCHLLTAMMLYNYFIPISLYISIEIVKVLQTIFINQDIKMYHEETCTPARARTSNLNEELGQVNTILSDKTGTLTSNSMEFVKCSIHGVPYGCHTYHGAEEDKGMDRKRTIKGFNFKDDRIMNGNWVKEPHAESIQMFFRVLAICHTAIPELNEGTGVVTYEAESPDEAAFVIAASELGFEFYKRTQRSISLRELDPYTGNKVDRSYRLLNILEFNSTRKRMSVIVEDEDGKLLLLTKGADSVMFQLLGKDRNDYVEKTKEHLNDYANIGLRTLVVAYRELSKEEYENFNKEFTEAKTSIASDRDEKIEQATKKIEKDMILLGVTGVEDKLQQGVPECINKLAHAGIKIWVLTGDKMETAINIGYSCNLLRQGMNQIIIKMEEEENKRVQKRGNGENTDMAHKLHIIHQISKGKRLKNMSDSEEFALIIDGNSLTYALENDVKNSFLELAIGCASVICCRSSPKQKALVTRLVKSGTGKVTLAIGDGANDVGMLQEADIGIGISGAEGMQAVMASDVAIAQFRFLERLLLVHGHWCYRRISSMVCYFFYKNLTFGTTIFLYEAFTSFSGEPAYNDWFMSFYNTLFTSFPVIALGVFDQDVSARLCLKFPALYQEGIQNILFRWRRILAWMFTGLLNAATIFFLTTHAFKSTFLKLGYVVGRETLGPTMYSIVVWVVNLQMALFLSYFTLVQHIAIWGSVAVWYLFLLAYGNITPVISTNAFMVFVEALAPAPLYWIVVFLVTVAALIPYFAFSALQMRFFPMYHQKVQWMRADGGLDE